MEILERENYRIVHLTDGNKIREAAALIRSGEADGVNCNFIENFPNNINEIGSASGIKFIQINLYPKSYDFDYRIIDQLTSLETLDILTYDKCEINYSNYPQLKSTAIFWRPKAKSLYNCTHIKKLFLGKYTEKNLSKLERLTSLEYLRINTGSINSLEGISSLKNIKTLYLMQATKLEDISGIETLKKLKLVYIANCKKIKNIELLNSLNKSVQYNIVGTTPEII